MLTNEDYGKLSKAYDEYDVERNKVMEEIERVLKVICNFYRLDLDYFYLGDGDDVDYLDVKGLANSDDNEISFKYVVTKSRYGGDGGNRGKKMHNWNPMPVRFLYMSDEEIAIEVQDVENENRKNHEDKIAAALKAKEKKEADKKAKQILAAKLTPEERKLLGIKL